MTLKNLEFTKKMIGKKNVKSGISLHFKHNNGVIKDPDQIFNAFCNIFTNVGPNHAAAIPQSKKMYILSS